MAIFVSKLSHCLFDILGRYSAGELNIEIPVIVSNHNDLRAIAEKFDIPFHYISTENISRDEHENLIKETLKTYEFDYLVLAKFMRILSSDFVANFKGKIINIHHSFLPAFVGANPYKQAYEKGVKLIGATAHYVTADLDQGPIIEQDVERVSHDYNVEQLRELGEDVERNVLARAVKWHLEDRIIVDGNKTVVFQ